MTDEIAAAKAILDSFVDPWQTEQILAEFEAKGLAVYKKKVFNLERRDVVSDPITPEKILAIIKEYADDPDITLHQVAAKHNVNHGRVSEILNGHRKP